MILIDGKLASSVSVDDRSYQYGDGCFSTILTLNGQAQYLDYHRQRLEACLQTLLIPIPDWNQTKTWIEQVALPDTKAGVKVHISRGSGEGRGYSPEGYDHPRVMVSSFAYPEFYNRLLTQGIALGICQQKLGLNPLLAGHKHNNRLEQILLKNEVTQLGYTDGVVLDIAHHVVETTMANLFWITGKKIYTPSLAQAGVSGVIRRIVLELICQDDLLSSVGDFSLQALLDADEVFMTNSILGVVPVIRIADRTYNIGEKTRDIQKRVNVC